MQKFIKFSLLSIAFLSVISLFNIKSTEAQNVICPAGYTCTPVTSVPNCPTGYVCTKTSSEGDITSRSTAPTVGGTTVTVSNTTKSQISTNINSSVLSLQYNGDNEQGNLNARIAFTVNGGNNGIYIFKDTVGVEFIGQNNVSYSLNRQTRTLEAVSKVSSVTNKNGLNFFYVEPGKSVNFVVNSTVPVNTLFAGTYRATLYSLYTISNTNEIDLKYQVVTPNSTNAVVVVGEKGPYIKNITSPSKSGEKITITGERLEGKTNKEVVTLFLDGVSSGLGFTSDANGKEIQLTLPKTLSKGRHIFEVNNSVTGRSNQFGFEVDSESSSTNSAVSISAYLADANSDKAGIWDNFGPGAGNSNKTKKDWHWVVYLNKNNNESKKIKSITVTHAGYEGWSTASSNIFGTKPYPLVALGNQSTSVPINKITKYLDDNSGVTPSFNNKSLSFDLYGQIESSSWRGGTVMVKFTDGTEVTANIPASSVKPVECPVGYVCTDSTATSATTSVYPANTTPSPSATVTPTNQPLYVSIKSPSDNSTVNLGSVAFTGTASGGSGSYKYMWNFGDNNGISDGRLINGGTEKIYHNFIKEGTYNVKLYVVDAKTSSISNTSTITVKVQSSNTSTSGVTSSVPALPTGSATTNTTQELQIPSILGFYPTITRVGDSVSVTGKGFDKVNSYDIYLENDKGISATPVLKSKMPESMVFTVPNMPAGIYRLYIVGRDGNSNTVNLTIASVSGANASAAWEWVSSLFK